MTAEEFWDKIVISEEEKEVSKYFLEYRGVAEHENVRVFFTISERNHSRIF